MRRIFGMLLCLVLVLIGVVALADVSIDETNFPDENFRQYILDAGFDSDEDGVLTDAELADVLLIQCVSKSITTLKGIEYFHSLKQLHCSYNQLTSMDISENTALEY